MKHMIIGCWLINYTAVGKSSTSRTSTARSHRCSLSVWPVVSQLSTEKTSLLYWYLVFEMPLTVADAKHSLMLPLQLAIWLGVWLIGLSWQIQACRLRSYYVYFVRLCICILIFYFSLSTLIIIFAGAQLDSAKLKIIILTLKECFVHWIEFGSWVSLAINVF